MELRGRPGLFFAGQITGVEGYVESIASGLVAGASAAARALGREPLPFPTGSMVGALMAHITAPGGGDPQPMNANFGLLPEVPVRGRRTGKRGRRKSRSTRSAGSPPRCRSRPPGRARGPLS
jgi:methylenetetrahydrofolate--tRNA-(uracil-5-)-methyltransferase